MRKDVNMQPPDVSRDDLLDVMEMTEKLETYIYKKIKGNERSLGISALMSASINSMIGLCSTMDEVIVLRNTFIQIFDTAIKEIKIKGNDRD